MKYEMFDYEDYKDPEIIEDVVAEAKSRFSTRDLLGKCYPVLIFSSIGFYLLALFAEKPFISLYKRSGNTLSQIEVIVCLILPLVLSIASSILLYSDCKDRTIQMLIYFFGLYNFVFKKFKRGNEDEALEALRHTSSRFKIHLEKNFRFEIKEEKLGAVKLIPCLAAVVTIVVQILSNYEMLINSLPNDSWSFAMIVLGLLMMYVPLIMFVKIPRKIMEEQAEYEILCYISEKLADLS